MRELLLAALLVFTSKPLFAARALMEGIAASSSTIMVDTVNVRVGVRTASPAYALHVASGDVYAQYGVIAATATLQATGNTTYDLTLSSGIQFLNPRTGIKWQDGTVSTTSQSGPAGPTGAAGANGGASTMTVAGVVNNFLPSADGVTTAFTLSQSYSSTSSVHVVLDGLTLYNPTDYSLSGQTLNMVTAPASNSSSFYAFYDVYTSTLPGLITSGSGAGGSLSGTYPNPSVATNANLTGPITSVGNATTIAGPVPISAIDTSTLAPKANPTFTGTVNTANIIISGDLTTNATGFQITSISPQTFTNTSIGPCMTGSTGTLTCVGGSCSVFLSWTSEWHSATLANNPYISFLVDGAPVAGSNGLNSMQEPVANYYASVSAQYLKLNLGAGTHNFCAAFWVGANSIIVGTGGNSFSGFVVH